jgi:ParB/RepB/Spo0J family partition protein
LREIPVSLIEESPTRMNSEFVVDDIASSISKYGQFSPIWVRAHPAIEGNYQVIFGNRRLATARKLGWKTIAANVVSASDAEALAMAFSENCDRMDFSDYEKAILLENLHNIANKSYSEVAELIGRSPAFVSLHVNMLRLFSDGLSSKAERSKMLHSLTEKHCRALAKIQDPNERWNTAKLAVGANLGVRELEKICNRLKSRHSPTRRRAGSDADEIKRIILERARGLSSRSIEDYYASICQKHFSSFSMFPNLERTSSRRRNIAFGRDELRDETQAKEYTLRVLKMLTAVKMRIENLRIRVSVSMAFATLTLAQEFVLYGEKIDIRTRETLVFEKDGNWKLVHEHTSTPDTSLLQKIAVLGRRSLIVSNEISQ